MRKLADIIGTANFWISFLAMISGAVLFSISGKGYQPLLIYGTLTFLLQLGLIAWHIRNDRSQHEEENS